MGVNSLPKTVTRHRPGCDLNPGPSAPESSTLTTRLPSHTTVQVETEKTYTETYNENRKEAKIRIYKKLNYRTADKQRQSYVDKCEQIIVDARS